MKNENDSAYLERVFGTGKLGDCKNCKYVLTQHSSMATGAFYKSRTNKSHPCNSDICIMTASLDWKHKKERAELAKQAGEKGGIINRIQKGQFVGITHEYIEPPWVIRYSDETQDEHGKSKVSKMWYNTKSGIGGKGVYREVIPFGDMIACWKGNEPKDIEVYSTQCLDRNIIDGDITVDFDMGNKNVIMRKDTSIVIGETLDTTSGKRMTILVSKYGNMVAMPKQEIKYVSTEEKGMMISFGYDTFIRLTNNFDIITKSSKLFAIKIK